MKTHTQVEFQHSDTYSNNYVLLWYNQNSIGQNIENYAGSIWLFSRSSEAAILPLLKVMMRGVVPPHGAAFSRCHCIHQQGARQQSRSATLACFIAPGTKQPIGSDARPRHLLYVVFQLTTAYQVSLEAQRISHVRKQSCARSHWVAGRHSQ